MRLMKMLAVSLIGIVLLFSTIACGSDSAANPMPTTTPVSTVTAVPLSNHYESYAYGYAIDAPQGWQLYEKSDEMVHLFGNAEGDFPFVSIQTSFSFDEEDTSVEEFANIIGLALETQYGFEITYDNSSTGKWDWIIGLKYSDSESNEYEGEACLLKSDEVVFNVWWMSDKSQDEVCKSVVNSFRVVGAPSSPIVGWQTYTNESKGFSISVPKYWDISHDVGGVEIVVFEAPTACLGDKAVIEVTVNDYEHLDLATFCDAWKSVNSEYYADDNYELISEEEVTVSEMPAVRIVFSETSALYEYKQMWVIMVKDERYGVIISCYCPTACWDEYSDIFDGAVNRFDLLD